MEDDKSLERQKRAIKEEVEALEDASGISRERMLENKVTAFNESMSQLKSERHGLLKQRAQLTQELERRGFSARGESQATSTSSDVSKKKFAARENLISRLIQDSRSSQMLVDRLKNGESFTDAKKHVKMEERREAEKTALGLVDAPSGEGDGDGVTEGGDARGTSEAFASGVVVTVVEGFGDEEET